MITLPALNYIIMGKRSLNATKAVIVVAIRVGVGGVVAVRHAGVRAVIVPIAAAKTAGKHPSFGAAPVITHIARYGNTFKYLRKAR